MSESGLHTIILRRNNIIPISLSVDFEKLDFKYSCLVKHFRPIMNTLPHSFLNFPNFMFVISFLSPSWYVWHCLPLGSSLLLSLQSLSLERLCFLMVYCAWRKRPLLGDSLFQLPYNFTQTINVYCIDII